MKSIDELNIPDHVRYAQSHEWVKAQGDKIKIGISDYAQDQLGDVVFVELPKVGAALAKGQEFGTVESVKAVSALFMPVSGEIVAINTLLETAPETVNKKPYDEGWMIEIKPENPADINTLMTKGDYVKMLKGI